MKNEKKNTFVAPPWLTNLSPFIFLAITVLVLILALKVLPPTLANSLYTYLAVFKIWRKLSVQLGFWQRLLYGSFGAASPEVIRWYALAKKTDGFDLPSNLVIYGIATVLFIVFGGIFATLWKDDNEVKCFYLGVTFPTVVSALLAGAFRP
jgi:hypothetical protein